MVAGETRFDKGEVERFWALVQISAEKILHGPPMIAENYRRSVEGSPAEEQLAVLHDEPLFIASSITGVEITAEAMHEYQKLVSDEVSEANERLSFKRIF